MGSPAHRTSEVRAESSYRFVMVTGCRMCGAPTREAKVLGRRLSAHQGIRPTRRTGIATTVMRCRQCRLVFANPIPLPIELDQHYAVSPEDYWTADELANEVATDYYAHRFRELWNGTGVPRALDVGAGLGRTMSSLQRNGFDTWGIEPSASFRERALQQEEIRAERLIEASAEAADFPANSFDYIIFGAVLEHLSDPGTSLARATGWLRRGGLIWVAVPSSRWLISRLINAAYRLQGLDYVTNISPMHTPYHLYEFSRRSFELHGRANGYEVAAARMVVCDPFLPGMLGRIAARVMRATDTGMEIEVWLRETGGRQV